MLNPDKYIRAVYIAKFAGITSGGKTVPTYSQRVPNNINPVPSVYILIHSQSKNETGPGKPGDTEIMQSNRKEWTANITVDIVSNQPKGHSNMAIVEDIEQEVLNRIYNGLYPANFLVKDTKMVSATELNGENATQSVDRKVLIFTHWINER